MREKLLVYLVLGLIALFVACEIDSSRQNRVS